MEMMTVTMEMIAVTLTCLTLMTGVSAAKYTPLYERCGRVQNGHDCLGYQNAYGCRAIQLHKATLQSNVADYTCISECAPSPLISRISIYQEKIIIDRPQYYTGVNVTWSLDTNSPDLYRLRGFLLELTSNNELLIMALSVNVSQIEIPETSRMLFHYDCLFPVRRSRTWNLTIKSIPYNPQTSNHLASTQFVLNADGDAVVMTTNPTTLPPTTTTSTTTPAAITTVKTTPTTTTTPTIKTATTPATTKPQHPTTAMTSTMKPTNQVTAAQGQRSGIHVTSPHEIIMTSDASVTTTHYKEALASDIPGTTSLETPAVTNIPVVIPTQAVSPELSTGAPSRSLIGALQGENGIIIGVLSGVIGVILLVVVMYCSRWQWMKLRTGQSEEEQDVGMKPSAISDISVVMSSLDNANSVDCIRSPSVVVIYTEDSTELVKENITAKLTDAYQVNSIWEITIEDGVDLRQAVVDVLDRSIVIIIVSSSQLCGVVDALRDGLRLIGDIAVASLDVLVGDEQGKFASRICTVYFPHAKDFKLLGGFNDRHPIALPLGFDNLLGVLRESEKLHDCRRLVGPESTYAVCGSVIVDDITENSNPPPSPVVLMKSSPHDPERLESGESGFFEQPTTTLHVPLKYQINEPVRTFNLCSSNNYCGHVSQWQQPRPYCGDYTHQQRPTGNGFSAQSYLHGDLSRCQPRPFIIPPRWTSMETVNESEFVADINDERDYGYHGNYVHQYGTQIPARRPSLQLDKLCRTHNEGNSVSSV